MARLSRLPATTLQRMWGIFSSREFGGIVEAICDLYAVTRKPERLAPARLFDLDRLIDACVAGDDILDGPHADQHIPIFTGLVRLYDETGEDRYLTAARNFWRMVVPNRMYGIGGTSTQEFVNGRPVPGTATPGSYFTVSRTWHDGDTVRVSLGPVNLVARDPRRDLHLGLHRNAALSGDLLPSLEPVPREPLHFRLDGVEFAPFFEGTEDPRLLRRAEPRVLLGTLDSGVTDPARADGTTFLDAIWAAAPFPDESALVTHVRSTVTSWTAAGSSARRRPRRTHAEVARGRRGHLTGPPRPPHADAVRPAYSEIDGALPVVLPESAMASKAMLPIVYVRGFAGDTSGINKVVTDPFYGFNEGSTHVRVGKDEKPSFHQFESPLLRLHLDEGYHILVKGGQEAYLETHDDIPPNSMWVHRFYDVSASSWGEKPREFRLEDAAVDLLRLIETLKRKTGAPRVHLVAHSMGGLVCRCLLQKVLPDRHMDPLDYVDKLFTYGTPHGGIRFDVGFGLLERLRDATGIHGADIFGPRRMYEYLTPDADRTEDGPPPGWDARVMPDHEGAFPPHRVFCLVGTNPADYDVAWGLSSAAVGARSDGLVQIEQATVPGAYEAYVYRSHSGRYGLVNSEEGYQNLRRFLFGDLGIEAALIDYRLPPDEGVTWQAEVVLAIRGLAALMHQRLTSQWCPLLLPPPHGDGTVGDPVTLTTTFLRTDLPRPGDSPTMRYALHVRILSLRQGGRRILSFSDHLEQTADFDDILVIDVGTAAPGPGVWAAWNSVIPGAIKDHEPRGRPLGDEDPRSGLWTAHVPLPETAHPLLGADARIRLSVTPWE
ncbi:alpha/beta fold hydrolase [Streptomyces coeruleoprunus]|uniref:Alpha/beta fold hydrolase n=1 Tax=Streptomyces coeruleoprunus TaxID=285563 RepID=A0ABV9X8W6_9ACTN